MTDNMTLNVILACVVGVPMFAVAWGFWRMGKC